jgi:light-regulated signal transduction histidine kinase (bacteriophytochrome)
VQFRLHAAELEALNGELESFSYSVSHDLRAPVRAVLGYTRAIEEDYGPRLGDEGRRLLTVVQSEASRMGDLIDDLLAFSRLGRLPIVNVLVNMTSLAQDVATEHTESSGAGRVVIDIAPLPDVWGDRVLLRQVWVNLISNAVKYSGKTAEPRVHIWASQEAGCIVYYVRDNGVGFDMAYADKLFGVFQRLHRGGEFPGSGVGLAIVMRIVQRHGGTVWGDARLGAGATFSFALPRKGDE